MRKSKRGLSRMEDALGGVFVHFEVLFILAGLSWIVKQ